MCSKYLRSKESHPFRQEHLHYLFRIFLHRRLFHLPHLLKYSIIYTTVDSWVFYIGVIINTISFLWLLLFKLFQLWPLVIPLPSWHTSTVLSTSPFSRTTKISRLFLCISYPYFRISHFFQVAKILFTSNGIIIKNGR